MTTCDVEEYMLGDDDHGAEEQVEQESRPSTIYQPGRIAKRAIETR